MRAAPAHRKDLSELPLESVADLECVVVRLDPAKGPAIDAIPLTDGEIGGRAVLFHTRWGKIVVANRGACCWYPLNELSGNGAIQPPQA